MAQQSKINIKILAALACLLMTLIFCGHYIVAKKVLESIPPKSLASFRGIVGGSILCLFFYKDIFKSINRTIIVKISLLSLIAFVLNQLFFLEGMKRTAPVHAAVITNLVPVIIILLSVVFKLEKVDLKKICLLYTSPSPRDRG